MHNRRVNFACKQDQQFGLVHMFDNSKLIGNERHSEWCMGCMRSKVFIVRRRIGVRLTMARHCSVCGCMHQNGHVFIAVTLCNQHQQWGSSQWAWWHGGSAWLDGRCSPQHRSTGCRDSRLQTHRCMHCGRENIHAHVLPHSEIVLWGLVWSGFFALLGLNRDRTSFLYFESLQKTKPDPIGPVHYGSYWLQNWS